MRDAALWVIHEAAESGDARRMRDGIAALPRDAEGRLRTAADPLYEALSEASAHGHSDAVALLADAVPVAPETDEVIARLIARTVKDPDLRPTMPTLVGHLLRALGNPPSASARETLEGPLTRLAQARQTDVAIKLLQHGVPADEQKLQFAVAIKDVALIDALFEHGAAAYAAGARYALTSASFADDPLVFERVALLDERLRVFQKRQIAAVIDTNLDTGHAPATSHAELGL